MHEYTLSRLRQEYEHVDDIDLFIGGMLETPREDSLLGDTFRSD